MKTLLTIIGLSIALVASAAEPVKQPEPVKGWTYAVQKLSVESFYTARFSGDFDHAYQGVGIGIGYALTPHITASVRGVSYLDEPNAVNELSGRVSYSEKLKFISNKLVGYAFAEGGAGLQSGVGFGGAGGGLEYMLLKNVGLGTEADVRIDTQWEPSVGIAGFLRFHF